MNYSCPVRTSSCMGLSRSGVFGMTAMIAGLIGPIHVGAYETEDLDDNPSVQSDWTPPIDGFDWIQLVSDEWLKGEIIAMYNGKLEFDSDELDFLSFDFKDIKQIRTKRYHEIYSESHETALGAIFMKGDRVVVKGGREVSFDRGDLVAIAHGDEGELSHWTARVSLGLDLRSGNIAQLDYNTWWNIRRRTGRTRFVLEYLGTVSRLNDVDTVNNHRVTNYYDYFFDRNFFIRPVNLEYYRDTFQNIEHRVSLGAQLGYWLTQTDTTEWSVAVGPAYQFTKYFSVQPDDDETRKTPIVVAQMNYEKDLTKAIDFTSQLRVAVGSEESGGIDTHWLNSLEFELTRVFDFDVSFIWDRVQNPVANEDDAKPAPDDYRMITG